LVSWTVSQSVSESVSQSVLAPSGQRYRRGGPTEGRFSSGPKGSEGEAGQLRGDIKGRSVRVGETLRRTVVTGRSNKEGAFHLALEKKTSFVPSGFEMSSMTCSGRNLLTG